MKTLKQFIFETNKKRILYILIGAPGTGKSTWINKNIKNSSTIIISRDNIVDEMRKETGMTYDEAFKDKKFQNEVTKQLKKEVSYAFKSNQDIVIDMTNMSKKSRMNSIKFGKQFDMYIKGIVFKLPYKENKERLQKRYEKTNKFISDTVLNMMLNNYEEPNESEGFDEIEFFKQY